MCVCVYMCTPMSVRRCACTRVSTHRGCSEKPENATAEISSSCSPAGWEAHPRRWFLPDQITNPSATPRHLHVCSRLPKHPAGHLSSRPRPSPPAPCLLIPAPARARPECRLPPALHPDRGQALPTQSSAPSFSHHPSKYDPLPSAALSSSAQASPVKILSPPPPLEFSSPSSQR